MIALLAVLMLQAPVDQEVDALRVRMRAVEVEVAILKDRLGQRSEIDAASHGSAVTTTDVITLISIAAALLGGGKVALDRVRS